jgi:hypothetical protein
MMVSFSEMIFNEKMRQLDANSIEGRKYVYGRGVING